VVQDMAEEDGVGGDVSSKRHTYIRGRATISSKN
jgi:hypothetical protein